MKFDQLGLLQPIVRAVAAQGYHTPTAIQAGAIPPAIEGRDVFGCAQTGTGKTCAFALPILHRLAEAGTPRCNRRDPTRALILCPTRELATQIHESFQTYARGLKLRHAVVFGGVKQARQVRDLRAGVDVLIATPGRLLDLMNQGYVDLSNVESLVLDEADRMLDMGFLPDIRRIAAETPDDRQTLVFSATMPDAMRKLASAMMRDPVYVESEPISSTTERIDQGVYHVSQANKPELLVRVLGCDTTVRTLVFTRTKHGADKLVKALLRNDIRAEAIHGNKNQNARSRALAGFKSGRTPVLVATDVASRGIDVDNVTHVVNYDMPADPETYVHRIGRTARAGASGVALTFCDRADNGTLRAVERLTGVKLIVQSQQPDLCHEPPRGRPAGGKGTGPRRGARSGQPRKGAKPGSRRRPDTAPTSEQRPARRRPSAANAPGNAGKRPRNGPRSAGRKGAAGARRANNPR